MAIEFNESTKQFHLYNDEISYIIHIMSNNQIGNIYYGKRLNHKEDMSYLNIPRFPSQAAKTANDETALSLQYMRQEYPSYGTSDFRTPAYTIKHVDGSRVSNFEYESHEIFSGKSKLPGLPATYIEEDSEATSLEITLRDSLKNIRLILSYTIYENLPVITRNTRFINDSEERIELERAMSAAIDFQDANFSMLHLAGAWGRERHIKTRKLEQGVQSIGGVRGSSSAEHNPFIALLRDGTTEDRGEVYGFSFVYSGNHLEEVEVNQDNQTRLIIGIHPEHFNWLLNPGESFQTPEVVMNYSDSGLNKMSQTFHRLFNKHLVRGPWRDRRRPLLINNWESTYFDFNQDKLVSIAAQGKELGLELFVLDDGWFGDRNHDRAGLGDWYVTNFEKLPNGLKGLSEEIEALGMKFGLWFEPEMVNEDSNLYREHPDWVIATPGRFKSTGRNQYVLDFSREEVVDYIFEHMDAAIEEANLSYIKWDYNRYITEPYSNALDPEEQGMFFHKYILGLYSLYERLIEKHPDILFESCSSGGARFDAGMLYYAPETWTSDNSDAMDRLKIQYGTSMVYPLSSISSHVTAVPNLQNGRITPLETRANVAYFGTFGYEMDLTTFSNEELERSKEHIQFYKDKSSLIRNGLFYRLRSPFENNTTAWMVVSEEQDEAMLGYYRSEFEINYGHQYLKLKGLDPNAKYKIAETGQVSYGDELMQIGVFLDEGAWGMDFTDYASYILTINKID